MEKKQVDNIHTHLNSLDSEVTYTFHWLRTCYIATLRGVWAIKNLLRTQEEENEVLAEASQCLTQKSIGNNWYTQYKCLFGDTRVRKVRNLDFNQLRKKCVDKKSKMI